MGQPSGIDPVTYHTMSDDGSTTELDLSLPEIGGEMIAKHCIKSPLTLRGNDSLLRIITCDMHTLSSNVDVRHRIGVKRPADNQEVWDQSLALSRRLFSNKLISYADITINKNVFSVSLNE